MSKTVLILGNGFDLAHELPTKYSHFLDFCYMVCLIKKINIHNVQDLCIDFFEKLKSKEYNKFDGFLYCSFVEHIKNSNILTGWKFENSEIKTPNNIDCDKIDELSTHLYKLLKDNIWYEYLQKMRENKNLRGENWIDFESEISYIIQVLDKYTVDLSHEVDYVINEIGDRSIDLNNKFKPFVQLMRNRKLLNGVTVRKLRKHLFEDLKTLSEALEVYLSEYVLKQQIVVYSPDIREIEPEYVINFNYTNTYSKIYNSSISEFHIHGSCRNDVFIGENNIVLGIDEYWSEQERDDHTNFTIFKKFAQRIQKRTGKKHFEIYEELKRDQYERVCVYVFGHSLDVTDKDILKMFFDENFEVTIFYRNEETEGEYIANVIGIIGEQKLIERVNQNSPTIIFQKQADMIGKEPDENVKPDCEEEEEPEEDLVTAK